MSDRVDYVENQTFFILKFSKIKHFPNFYNLVRTLEIFPLKVDSEITKEEEEEG